MDEPGAKTRQSNEHPQPPPDKRDVHGLVGKTLDGRLVVEGVIGAGGMGIVYLGHQTNVDRKVAIKVLLSERADENTVRRFKNEAKAASRLTHPNTITIHDFGNWGDLLYIVMEFLEGQALQDVVDDQPLVAPIRTCNIISQVLASLQEAHNNGIIHRDIKPDNIFLKTVGGESDFVKVLDFGVAKLGEQVGGSATLTQAGMIFGTPKYMSPEQAMAKKLTPASDMYSVGVVMYECLTGVAPFSASDPVSLLIQHVHDPAPRFAEVAPNVSVQPELEAIVLRALEKKPEDRFQSANEMKSAVDEALVRMKAAAGILSSGTAPAQQFGSAPQAPTYAGVPATGQPAGPPPTGPSEPLAPADSGDAWADGLGVGMVHGGNQREPVAAPAGGSPTVGGTTIVVKGGGTSTTLVLVIVLVGFILLGAVGFLIYRQMSQDGGTVATADASQAETDAQQTPPLTDAAVTESDAGTEAPDVVVAVGDTTESQVIDAVAIPVEPDAGGTTPPVPDAAVAVEDAAQADLDQPDETVVALADVNQQEDEPVVDTRNLVRVRFDRRPSDARVRISGREYERDGSYYVFDLADGERFRVSASADHHVSRRIRVDLSDADDDGTLVVRVRLELDPCDPANGPVDPYVCD